MQLKLMNEYVITVENKYNVSISEIQNKFEKGVHHSVLTMKNHLDVPKGPLSEKFMLQLQKQLQLSFRIDNIPGPFSFIDSITQQLKEQKTSDSLLGLGIEGNYLQQIDAVKVIVSTYSQEYMQEVELQLIADEHVDLTDFDHSFVKLIRQHCVTAPIFVFLEELSKYYFNDAQNVGLINQTVEKLLNVIEISDMALIKLFVLNIQDSNVNPLDRQDQHSMAFRRLQEIKSDLHLSSEHPLSVLERIPQMKLLQQQKYQQLKQLDCKDGLDLQCLLLSLSKKQIKFVESELVNNLKDQSSELIDIQLQMCFDKCPFQQKFAKFPSQLLSILAQQIKKVHRSRSLNIVRTISISAQKQKGFDIKRQSLQLPKNVVSNSFTNEKFTASQLQKLGFTSVQAASEYIEAELQQYDIQLRLKLTEQSNLFPVKFSPHISCLPGSTNIFKFIELFAAFKAVDDRQLQMIDDFLQSIMNELSCSNIDQLKLKMDMFQMDFEFQEHVLDHQNALSLSHRFIANLKHKLDLETPLFGSLMQFLTNQTTIMRKLAMAELKAETYADLSKIIKGLKQKNPKLFIEIEATKHKKPLIIDSELQQALAAGLYWFLKTEAGCTKVENPDAVLRDIVTKMGEE